MSFGKRRHLALGVAGDAERSYSFVIPEVRFRESIQTEIRRKYKKDGNRQALAPNSRSDSRLNYGAVPDFTPISNSRTASSKEVWKFSGNRERARSGSCITARR